MEKARRKQGIRPTSSLVKQAIFNILKDINGLAFLDLFAGTGQIGLMAEERGANVIFVEKNPKFAREITKKTKGKVVISDAIKFLTDTEVKLDIIFADPPYNYKDYNKLIELSMKILNEGGILLIEHSKKSHLNAQDERIYGDTALSIWRK
ncbi:MAG: RsmD family RNA methyltransferase [Aquificaceae bacterium]